MDMNKVFSLATVVALVGLLVLHPAGAAQTLNAAGGLLTSYIKTGQAQGVPTSG